ncbi:unnamed protein product [Psylliodes chrysocephalus]|uniref:BESS domain-containing protein n=1 Tax=Psylliodes chrysocephalus TaxID=3402493 RepID=A0A9P0DDP4_9CUCU|nr:unnamed protein product [Psylliodes chrysocephala]
MVMVHEIGHSLGLSHSSNKNAIMFPWYQEENRQLHEDDIMGIESLYGRREKYAKIPEYVLNKMSTATTTAKTTAKTTTTTASTKKSSTTKKPLKSIHTTTMIIPSIKKSIQEFSTNLCNIQIPNVMFIATAPTFPNYRLYIAYNTFLWKLDLNDMHIPLTPELITDYLPNELKSYNISHIFQNSVGDLITINNRMLYAVSFPNLNIQHSFKFPINIKTINALFQTNSGQTYLLYNNNSYIEFNETGDILNRGPTKDLFPGIPEDAKKQVVERRQQSNATSQPDPDMAFLQSVLLNMKAMDNRQKIRFKKGILNLAEEILYAQSVQKEGASINAQSKGSSMNLLATNSLMNTLPRDSLINILSRNSSSY